MGIRAAIPPAKLCVSEAAGTQLGNEADVALAAALQGSGCLIKIVRPVAPRMFAEVACSDGLSVDDCCCHHGDHALQEETQTKHTCIT